MKVVKRIGVYETNSSSTHSFTIVPLEKSKKIKGAFKLSSPLAKLVWFLGLVDNAKRVEKYYNEQDLLFQKKFWTAKIKKKIKNFTIPQNVTQKEFVAQMVEDILLNSKKIVLEFKKMLLAEFCKIKNITKNETEEQFLKESCRFLPLYKISINKTAIENYIANNISNDTLLQEAVNKYPSKTTAFKQYIKLLQNQEKYKFSCFKCDYYFGHGILIDCTCPFKDFYAIREQLDLLKKSLSYQDFASWLLSDSCVVVGKEDCCGLEPIYTTETF